METSESKGSAHTEIKNADRRDAAPASAESVRAWRPGQRYDVAERPVSEDDLSGRLPATVLEYQYLAGHAQLLMETIFLSLKTFGFYTRHAPRYCEYPWIAEQVLDAPRPGSVLDLGAGVSPLPVMLAARDWSVTTVDYSEMKRTTLQPGNLNEWGFLDYREVDERIRSINDDFSKTGFPDESFDVIYSVSVVEHMPAAIRRKVVETAAKCLKGGGRLILTLDLEPGSFRLWNLDRGKKVEPQKKHGNLDQFLGELRAAGIVVEKFEIRRGLPRSRTDIVFLNACKV